MKLLKTISLFPSDPKEVKKEIAFLKKINKRMFLFGNFNKKDVEHTLELLKQRLF